MQPPKRTLITGASSGIGRAVATALAQRRYPLFLTGRNEGKLRAVTDGLGEGKQVGSAAFDLVAPRGAEQVVQRAVEHLGGLDAVVHCAGLGLIKPALETTDAEFCAVTNVNLRGTFLIAQAAMKVMAAQKSGLFVALPGTLGKYPMKNAAAYAASKFGTVGLLKCMAAELQRVGIKVVLLHLGGVDSPFWDNLSLPVQREKMIPVGVVAQQIITVLELPSHLVLNELILQPESHQLL
jgi:NAD(P)-dependent dehydrogenase (short-subunit alcohol dehydrogenase family)